MKNLFILFFFLAANFAAGQDTMYVDKDWHELKGKDGAEYYKVTEKDPADTNAAVIRTYFMNGNLQTEKYFSDYKKYKQNGKSKVWNRNGQLVKDLNYKDGKLDGQILTYYPDGKPRRIDYYTMDSLVTGRCLDQNGLDVPHYPYMSMPEFPGGEEKMYKYMVDNIKYPKKCRKKGIEGRVFVNFTVNADGSVSNVRLLKGVHEEMDKVAMQVVADMPDWKPGTEDGYNIAVSFNLPVNFRLK